MSSHDCITYPPKVAGNYNVSVKGVMTFLPIYWHFDGVEWNRDDWHYDLKELKPNDACWYD